MGSRRGRHAALVAILLGAGACTSGSPPGFQGGRGDAWSMPLIGPLENGLLLVPVTIEGHGPYVFAIDPDATVSAIDDQILGEAKFMTGKGPHRLDEDETSQIRFYAEVTGIELGTLIVERRTMMVVRKGTFDREGRRIAGILGRDVLSDSLVFGFDRDQGLAQLVVKKSWKPPPGAVRVPYELVPAMIPNIEAEPESRRLVTATIGGESFAMHVDLGAEMSSLREGLWDKAKLTPADIRTGQIDEVGMPHKIDKVAAGQPVAVAGISAAGVHFAPFTDKRWRETDIAGTLGLDFFRGHDVWVDWDGKALYLVPRTAATVQARVGRWDVGALGKCPHDGCVEVKTIDPTAGKPLAPGAIHPGVVLSVKRDEIAGGMDLEITLEAKGHPELPRLVINMSPNGDRVMEHLKPEWANIPLTVIDASPFPRDCKSATGCVDKIAP